MMKELELLREQGFVLIKNFFEKEKILNLKKQMIECFECISHIKYTSDIDIINFFKKDFDGFLGWACMCQHLNMLFELASSKQTTLKLNELGLKIPSFNMKPHLLFSNKHTAKHTENWKLPSHQDWQSCYGSLNGVVLWFSFDNIIGDLGPLEIAPKSHTNGALKSVGVNLDPLEDGFQYIAVPVEVGDIIILDYFTVHRSGINNSDEKIRWTGQFRYDDATDVDFITRKYQRVNKEIRFTTS